LGGRVVVALFPSGAEERQAAPESKRDLVNELSSIAATLQALHTSADNLTRTVDKAKTTIDDSAKWAQQAKEIATKFSSLSQTIADIASSIEAIGSQSKLISLNP
jgi:methyl-accepting chemotaxis protein